MKGRHARETSKALWSVIWARVKDCAYQVLRHRSGLQARGLFKDPSLGSKLRVYTTNSVHLLLSYLIGVEAEPKQGRAHPSSFHCLGLQFPEPTQRLFKCSSFLAMACFLFMDDPKGATSEKGKHSQGQKRPGRFFRMPKLKKAACIVDMRRSPVHVLHVAL